jgi:hypothetical protein
MQTATASPGHGLGGGVAGLTIASVTEGTGQMKMAA